ncbi:MAG: SDR family NAD(P)-dependent oxidoreductase [Clostridiales bacterium]|jgi:NADP-dependent 3-hydroxy acid dehydrogenase YdfG|nr:SDR family NAD(P)-dependent oxidoreductase [Clostridiales bacterium]
MKYALFTGATGGLGGAGARAMAQEGWTVFAAGTNAKALEELGKEQNIIPIMINITDQDSIDSAYAEIRKITPTLDAIINFSGIHMMASLIEGDVVNDLERMLDINVMGMARINKTFFPMVKAGNGRIINCSSECGWMKAQPFNGPYTITKYAVEAYNDSLRRELLWQDVPVVKIQPGSFKTNMHEQAEAGFNKLLDNTQYYQKQLKRMKPMMQIELKMANDPKHLVKALLNAVNSDKPKINYRVKNSKLLGSLEFIPDKMIDVIYKTLLK